MRRPGTRLLLLTNNFCDSPPSRYDAVMSENYRQLLDATIQHFEDLKSRGVRHVAVAPETCGRALSPARAVELKRRRQHPGGRSEEARISPSVAPKPSPAGQSLVTSAARKVEAPSPSSNFHPPSSPEKKAAAFTALRERALACVKCQHLVGIAPERRLRRWQY